MFFCNCIICGFFKSQKNYILFANLKIQKVRKFSHLRPKFNFNFQVVLRLQKSCHKLNDEELAKLAVALLNCQSLVEGRRIFPCTDSMSIKECTIDMDADTWNTYHLMSNRARAVCYSVRQIQFRGITEQTVNKLMEASKKQLSMLENLADDQKDLHFIAKDTLSTITKGNSIIYFNYRTIFLLI